MVVRASPGFAIRQVEFLCGWRRWLGCEPVAIEGSPAADCVLKLRDARAERARGVRRDLSLRHDSYSRVSNESCRHCTF